MKCSFIPPDFWDRHCIKNNNIFSSSQWHNILKEGFNCTTIYISDKNQKDGVSITIFKKAFLKIGYLSFPTGGTLSGETLDNNSIQYILKNILPKFVHILRIPSGKFTPANITCKTFYSCPETYITNLGDWTLEQISKRCRRDINKSIRENENVEVIKDPGYAEDFYNLYINTIKKNKGLVRYTKSYFKSIITYSKKNKNIRCTCIKYDRKIIAFLILVVNEKIAYYLHGAIDYNFRKSLPNDLLIYNAIEWAKENNIKTFNLMCSPIKQPSLVKYKEKWGGETSENVTFEYGVSVVHYTLFKLANFILNAFNNIKSRLLN